MDAFADRIRRFISSNRLLADDESVLVGLSGGADSVALLCVLLDIGVTCRAVHCNFHLRGNESDRDEDFCIRLCKNLEVRLDIVHFDVYNQCRKSGESVEMACRTLRYNHWREMIANGYADVIAVGHHCEDNIETLWLNLMRGCGIAGVKGIMPRNGDIIRPMLEVTRADIESYLNGKGIGYVTDSTNLSNEYKRNRLRNVVLPVLEREFPGAMAGITRSLGYLRDNYEFYFNAMNVCRGKYESAEGIDLVSLTRNEDNPALVLFDILAPMGFGMTVVCNILDDIYRSGSKFHSDSRILVLERGWLSYVEADFKEPVPLTGSLVGLPLDIRTIPRNEFESLKKSGLLGNKMLALDGRVLDGNPVFSIRATKRGDRLAPFGMRGTRLVSDIFSDMKIPFDIRRRIPVLVRDGELLWIVGIRSSRHFAVTEATTSILLLGWRDNNLTDYRIWNC